MNLTAAEQVAIEMLKNAGGCILLTSIPEKRSQTVFGDIIPGLATFKRLEKKGLIFITEEEPFDLGDGELFDFTPSVYLNEEASTQST